MKIETIELEKCSKNTAHDPYVSVTTCVDGYSVSVWDEWGDTACVALSPKEAVKLAALLTHPATRRQQ